MADCYPIDLSRTQELFAVLCLAAALVGWQLFVPPIIGLADQGDFVRLLGPFGYAPQPKGPEHKYWYLTRKFVWDPSYREPRWEQISSEFIPASLAFLLNRTFHNPQSFDLTLFGMVHAAFFLLAFGRLLFVTRNLRRHRILWAAMLLVLTDVGYVAYWNSLYTEPASCIWLLFLVAESIAICESGRVSTGAAVRWSVFAVLLVMAKIQNAPLGIPLAAFAVAIACRAGNWTTRSIAVMGAVGTLAAGVAMYRTSQPAPRVTNIYDIIFYGILPESDDPVADLKTLGLDPAYAKYSGTLAWTEGTGIADGYLVNALLEKMSPIKLSLFYVTRPARLWKHTQAALLTAFSLRPEFCGNFDASAGRLPGARSHAIALWSHFHWRYLSQVGTGIVVALALAPLTGVLLLCKRSLRPARRRWTEMGICLAACCLLAFLAAAFGDTWDSVKHLYLFNLLLDACLLFALGAALQLSEH